MHPNLRLASLVLFALAAAGCGESATNDGAGERRATDWNAVREWTAEKRDEFIAAARRQHDQLRAEGDVLRQRLDDVAERHRPSVEAALAEFEQLRDRHREELYRMNTELRASASEAFDRARLESSKVRAELYEAYERARTRLEQALADSAGEPAPQPVTPAGADGASDADAPAGG